MLKTQAKSVLEAATEYIESGWWVLPCLPRSKEPHFGLIKRAYLDATNDIDLVKFWLKLDPNMNLGVNAIKSGLIIIDVDCRNGGSINKDWDQTFTVKTGDGWHFYYRDTQPGTYRSSLGQGLDIKYKGYVVTAPSIHPNGARYEISNNLDVADLPTIIEEQICKISW